MYVCVCVGLQFSDLYDKKNDFMDNFYQKGV